MKLLAICIFTYFNSNTDVTFENMLQTLSMTEYEYINAIRSTLKRNKIFLKRSSMEVAINAYNLEILMLLESNMDLQKVLDAYIAAFYMVNYVTKIEAGLSKLLREASDDIENGNLDLKQKLRKIANVFINGNLLTSQEAVYHALSLPLCISSRNVVYINTVPINQRSRMLKRPAELKLLSKSSKDIYANNILEKYEKRTYQLKDVCLADFVCNYNFSKKLLHNDTDNEDTDNNNENMNIKERKKRKVIRYYRYKIETDSLNYYSEHVLLFLPFRNEESEIEKADCKKLFYDNLSTIQNNKSEYCLIKDNCLEDALKYAEKEMYIE